MTTKQLNVRLPRSSHQLLTELGKSLDMTQVQVIIVALEYLAMAKGLTLPAKEQGGEDGEGFDANEHRAL